MRSRLNIAILLIVCTLSHACTNPFEGVTLAFKEPIQNGRFTFYIRDYDNKFPENTSFEILGPDANLIVNTLNDEKLEINKEGNLSLALRRDISPSNDSIVHFAVRINSGENHLPFLKEFRVQSRSNYSTTSRIAHLGIIQDKTHGLYLKKGTNSHVDQNGIILINYRVSATNSWTGLDGTIETKDLSFLSHYYNENAKGFIPNAGAATQPYNEKGEKLDYSFDLQDFSGGLYLQGYSDYKEAINWTNPIELELTVHDFDKASLDLMHYNTSTGRFTHFGKKNVNTDGNRFYLNLNMDKPGYWYAGTIRALCREGVSLSVISKYSDLDIQYLTRIRDTETKAVVKTLYSNINWKNEIKVNYIPKETETFTVELYDYSNYHGGNATEPFWTSQIIKNCEESEAIMDLFKLDAPAFVDVKFVVQCPNGTEFNPESLPKEMRAQYSPAGENSWRTLTTFTPETRQVKTYKLKIGETYDFRVSTDGGVTWPYKQNDYIIENQRWQFLISADNYCI
ncbi:hypothetical protein [Arcticibacterium luteifluviistationis]|uniref:Uncharacterized protein n=1 Tax=Arcticibacterium luteifluviistationis TaxID=1784714 RepID=A0A2Z4GA55_9BACT|nr:hypothetical protein [Arcticibacterium luteifluviistationis]AWV98034.1 hypothetical protein DJ013_07560 [Arcticibacterium luteifluviistationis]